jgi:hypothetical protein
MNLPRRIWQRIFYFFPFFLLIIGVMGFTVMFAIGGVEWALNTLIYVIPIIIAAIILVRGREIDKSNLFPVHVNRVSFFHFFLMYIVLLIISIIILLSFSTRTWGYFSIISLISGIIFLQIISERPEWTDYLIVLEIGLYSLNIIWGVSLKYPLYFGWTDTLYHLDSIGLIVQTSHIQALGVNYQNFPLFHIFNAIGTQITGLSTRTALFIFMGLTWEIGILFAFVIFKKLSKSSKYSLIACMIFASSSEIIFYGSYAITRSLAFVLLLCWLNLAFKKYKGTYIFINFIIMWALILTHHVTVLYSIPILLFVYIVQRHFLGNKTAITRLQLVPILLLTIFQILYLVIVANRFMENAVIPYIISIISNGTSEIQTINTASNSIFTVIYYSFVLLSSLLGIGIIFKTYGTANKFSNFISMALAGLIFLPIYVIGPLNMIPQAKDAMLYRLPLLVSPFIIFIVAFGFNYLFYFETKSKYQLVKKTTTPIISFVFIVLFTFFSMIFGDNGNDNSYLSENSASGREYFTRSEMISFSYLQQYGIHSKVLYGDYAVQRNQYSLRSFQSRQILITDDINSIPDGYLLFRNWESPNLLKDSILIDNIYNNNNVQIFIINKSGS